METKEGDGVFFDKLNNLRLTLKKTHLSGGFSEEPLYTRYRIHSEGTIFCIWVRGGGTARHILAEQLYKVLFNMKFI